MKVREYGILFWTVVGVLALLVASPALSRLLIYPRTEFLTELWLLDANHKAEDYPLDIMRNHNYSVILGVGNRLGHCAYYVVMMKFRNESQPGPTSFGPEGTRVPSNVSSLFNMSVFVGDLQTWEQPITFAFDYTYDNVTDRIDLQSMRVNDALIELRGYMVAYNASANGHYGFLFFETWWYRNETAQLTYHERFVRLKLNMTL